MKEITWAGGTHPFDLNSRRVSWMLQQAQHPFPGQYGDTPAAAFKRFDEGVYSPDDILNVIRIGLIGGGKSETEADVLLSEHVRGQPLAKNAVTAFEILAALFIGANDAGTST
jgi:hypothetical protein